MAKKKRTPKNSNKKSKKTSKRLENTIILGIFVAFIAVLVYLFYFVNTQANENVVAVVDGSKITRDDLDWWYTISVLPEDSYLITKEDFLMISLIPQELLVQKAKKEGIEASKEDVEKLLGLFIIENGLTLDEFEKHLESRGLAINDIKKSFEARVLIIKLLEQENISIVSQDGEKSFSEEDNAAFQDYLNSLIGSSKIGIFPENIYKLALKSFEATNDNICNEEKPIAALYTTSSCAICNESEGIFENAVQEFAENEKIEAHIWSLDTGDDLLTAKKENAVPKEDVEIFKKYSPDNLVPAVVLGCKYKKVGKFGIEEEDEFKTILKIIAG